MIASMERDLQEDAESQVYLNGKNESNSQNSDNSSYQSSDKSIGSDLEVDSSLNDSTSAESGESKSEIDEKMGNTGQDNSTQVNFLD